MELLELTWEEIYPVWKNQLWPNRVSPIEPASAIDYLGGINMSNTKFQPKFYGMKYNGQIVGVNSVIECSDLGYRSRGLWVEPTFRKQHIAKNLLDYAIKIALANHAPYIWSMPRHSALPAYLSAGFSQTSDWFDEGVEFGPNCFVKKVL